jgi:crossover junction endodeoxyribonuclease RuvC
MRVLGIDPGFGRTGYGVIDAVIGRQKALEYGCIETLPGDAMGRRLHDIFSAVNEIIAKYQPDVMAIEQLFFNRNVTTAFKAAEARGVVVLAAEMAGIPQFSYTPIQVKQAVVGYGRAEKKQVQEMVKVLLALTSIPKPDDAADALAIAITHAQASVFQSRMPKE